MDFFQKLAAIWQNVSLIQRALLVGIVLTLVIVGAMVTRWASRPDMKVLYSDLVAEEASKITEIIAEKDIAYELRNGGTTIYVPREYVYQLRLDMAKDGLPSGDQGGYKIFDDEKIGISPFVQEVNLKRAQQDELAMSIQMIDGIARARVHIVSAERSLFTNDAEQTSASVVLELKPGYRVAGLNIAAITHMVAGSVSGLKAENITVIDSDGHLLAGESDPTSARGAGTVQDYRERVEFNLEKKVVDMLTAVLGPDRASVKVSAVIDMNSINTVKESYEKGVLTKEEIKETEKIKPGAASGENDAPAPGSTESDSTTTSDYVVGKTVEQKADLPGQIKSLTVAAFVDLSPDDPNATEPIMAETDVADIIQKALGPKLSTDGLKVVNIKFNRPAKPLIDQAEPAGLDFIAIARQASLGIVAVCAMLVLKIFRSGKKKAATVAPAAGQLPAAGAAAGLLPAGAGGSDALMLKQQIANTLQNNPEQAKQLFTRWLEEGE